MSKKDLKAKTKGDDLDEKTSSFNKGSRAGKRNTKWKSDKRNSGKTQGSFDPKGKSGSSGRYSNSGGCDNDPRWYNVATPEGVSAAANISYFKPTGTRYQYNAPSGNTVNKRSLPGIGVIYWEPSVGYSDAQNSPINVAARNLYSYVRHANSGHTNYEAMDYMMYLLAMDGMYSWIETLKRVYGVCKLYSYTDKYVGKALVEALGFDYDDMVMNLEDFRAYINILSVKVGSFCVPNTLPYIARHSWMNRHLFWDTSTDKSQIYAYVQGMYPIFYLDEDSKGAITWYPIGATTPNYSNSDFVSNHMEQLFNWSGANGCTKLADYTAYMLNPIVNSEDFAIMSGDILKAYGAEGVIKLDAVGPEYVASIDFSPDVLDQINNTTFVGIYDLDEDGIIQVIPDPTLDPKNGYIEFKPKFVMATRSEPTSNFMVPMCNNWVINFEHSGITPDDTMVATRLLNRFTDSEFTASYASKWNNWIIKPTGTVKTMGSDCAICMRVYYYGDNPNTNNLELLYSDALYTVNPVRLGLASTTPADADAGQAYVDAAAGITNLTVSRLALLDKFDRHPRIVVPFQLAMTFGEPESKAQVTYTSTADWLDVHGDINYGTFVTPDKLELFSLAALTSEFDVTQFGRAGL